MAQSSGDIRWVEGHIHYGGARRVPKIHLDLVVKLAE
jgi:hypothetical protein